MMLRPYQRECLQAIRDHALRGVRRQVVAMPTGCGKTIVFSDLPKMLGLGPTDRTMVLVHRQELAQQAADKLRSANPDRNVAIEMGDSAASPSDNIVVAGVQSLCRRLDRYDPSWFKLLITDECHHSVAESYKQIYGHFGALDGKILHVGFSATIKRGDGQGLSEIYQRVVFHKSLPEMIAQGWLCDLSAWRVTTGTDISRVRSFGDDFAPAALSRAVNSRERNQLVCDAYLRHANGRKALAFCVDRAHARALAEMFRDFGVIAAWADGSMKAAERRAVIDGYRRRDIHVLTSCELIHEGFDDPQTNCILMCRPTRSHMWYTQALGRGTRIAPGKKDCVVLDLVDVCRKHPVISLPILFGLHPKINLAGRRVGQLVERIEKAGISAAHHRDVKILEGALGSPEYTVRRVDLFRPITQPPEVRQLSVYAWISVTQGMYRLQVPERRSLVITQNVLGRYEVSQEGPSGRVLLGEHKYLGNAFAQADGSVPTAAVGAVRAHARWRRKKPTPSQLGLAQKLNLNVGRMSRGELSNAISYHFGRSQGARQ